MVLETGGIFATKLELFKLDCCKILLNYPVSPYEITVCEWFEPLTYWELFTLLLQKLVSKLILGGLFSFWYPSAIDYDLF